MTEYQDKKREEQLETGSTLESFFASHGIGQSCERPRQDKNPNVGIFEPGELDRYVLQRSNPMMPWGCPIYACQNGKNYSSAGYHGFPVIGLDEHPFAITRARHLNRQGMSITLVSLKNPEDEFEVSIAYLKNHAIEMLGYSPVTRAQKPDECGYCPAKPAENKSCLWEGLKSFLTDR